MSTFRLQQFSIEQNLSGMKVCSDSLLFGAMIPVAGAQRVLDIGTGTGLLALMQAQKAAVLKCKIDITAIELTPEAATEAAKNFSASMWTDALQLIQQDVQSFALQQAAQAQTYDLIISNPPFFVDHSRTHKKEALRSIARHTDTLSYQQLCESMVNLLAMDGRAFVLIPAAAIEVFVKTARASGLLVVEITYIAESLKHAAKVAILSLNHSQNSVADDVQKSMKTHTVFKFDDNKSHTREVKTYLQPFLLRYGEDVSL